MNARTIVGENPEAILNALEKICNDGFVPTLGIVFASSKLNYQGILDVLDAHSISIFGANTLDKFTDKGIDTDQATILLLDLDPAYFRILLKSIPNNDFDAGVNLTREIGQFGSKQFQRPAFIISVSEFDIPGEAIVEGLLSGAGESTLIIGGFSGGKPFSQDHTIFTNKEICSRGIVCLIIDQDRVDLCGVAVSGWKPVGTPKTVTKSEGSWIYTIDDEPALDVLLRFTGEKVETDHSGDLRGQIGSSYPFQVIGNIGSPVMKPPLMYDQKTGAVMCGGQIPEGSKIRFSLPPDFDIVDTVIESARDIKNRVLPKADALLVFSCISRQATLGPLIEEEVTGLNDVWNVPMNGFFSLGEFGATKGGFATYHGTTCSWVAMREKVDVDK